MTREEAIKIIIGLWGSDFEDCLTEEEAKANKMAVKALQEPERKKGKWIGKPIAGYSKVRCSVCNEVFLNNTGKWKFCPNCGAEMEVEK